MLLVLLEVQASQIRNRTASGKNCVGQAVPAPLDEPLEEEYSTSSWRALISRVVAEKAPAVADPQRVHVLHV